MKLWACAALLLLADCTMSGSSRGAARLSGLIGQPETAVLERMGEPTRQLSGDGRTYLIYDSTDFFYVPGMQGIPPRRAIFHCETRFEIVGGRVLSFDQHGSGCD